MPKPVAIDWEIVEAMRKRGYPLYEIARKVDVGYSTLRRKLRRRKEGEKEVKRMGRPPKYLERYLRKS